MVLIKENKGLGKWKDVLVMNWKTQYNKFHTHTNSHTDS
jgi:hypothetical protein